MFFSRCVRISAEYMAMILETSQTIIVQTRPCVQYLMCFALYSFCSIHLCTGQEDKTMSAQCGKKTADSLWVIFLSDSAPSDNLWNPILVTSHSTPSCSLSHISKLDFIRYRKSYQLWPTSNIFESRTHFYLSRFAGRVLIVKGFVAKYIRTCSWLWREGPEIFCPNKNYILSHKSSVFYHT